MQVNIKDVRNKMCYFGWFLKKKLSFGLE